jgi:hypothetical protein
MIRWWMRPGGLDLKVFPDREERLKPSSLLVGQEAVAGVQGRSGSVQRVVRAPSVAV